MCFYTVLIIGWEFPLYNVSEADGVIEICAVVKGDTIQAITLPIISIETTDGTARVGCKPLVLAIDAGNVKAVIMTP